MKRVILLFVLIVSIVSNLLSQQIKNSVFLNDNNYYWADSVIENLTIDEKIGQLFMVIAYSNKSKEHKKEISRLIKKHKIGGLMFLQGGPKRQAILTNYYQSISKIPLMIALDAEWGVSMRLDSALRFPWQMTIGATMDSRRPKQSKIKRIYIILSKCMLI